MKKLISVLLVLAMLTAILCACNPAVPSETSSDDGTVSPVDPGTGAPIDTTEEITEPVETESRPYAVDKELNFNGETIKIAIRGGQSWDYNGTGDQTVVDAFAKRNSIIEENYGIKVELVEVNSGSGNTEYFQAVQNDIDSGTHAYDLLWGFGAYFGNIVGAGYATDLRANENINLDGTYFNQNYLNASSINGKNYMITGDMVLGQTMNVYCTYFNKELLASYHGDVDLYKAVDDGNWTMEYLLSLVKDVYKDTDNDNTQSLGDQYGLLTSNNSTNLDGYFYAFGLNTVVKQGDGTLSLNLGNETTANKITACIDLFHNTNGVGYVTADANSYNNYVKSRDMFANGQSVFYITRVCDAVQIAAAGVDFGVLPLVKYSKDDTSYSSGPMDSANAIIIPAGLSKERELRSGAFVDLMEYYSDDITTAYIEVLLKGQLATAPDDLRMYEMIYDNIKYDFGLINGFALLQYYNFAIPAYFRNCVMNKTEPLQYFKSHEEGLNTALAKFLENLG